MSNQLEISAISINGETLPLSQGLLTFTGEGTWSLRAIADGKWARGRDFGTEPQQIEVRTKDGVTHSLSGRLSLETEQSRYHFQGQGKTGDNDTGT